MEKRGVAGSECGGDADSGAYAVCSGAGTSFPCCSCTAAKYASNFFFFHLHMYLECSLTSSNYFLTDPTHFSFAAVAFTSASEGISVLEEGGSAMFCVAIVDDDNGGGGTLADITVNLDFPAVGSTNPTGTCRCQQPTLNLASFLQ